MENDHFEALYPDTARAQDIEKLARYIREGASCQLLSLPGLGRGTVLGLLTSHSKIQNKYFCVDAKSLLLVIVVF